MNLKKLERQAINCQEISKIVLDSVSKGIPADRCLAKFMRKNKYLGSRDRRLIYDLIFALFRWRGWTLKWERSEYVTRQFIASLVLDGKTSHPLLLFMANKEGLPDGWISFLKGKPYGKRFEELENLFGQTSKKGFELNDLFPNWFLEDLYILNNDKNNEKEKLLETLQTRPPTWIRFDAKNVYFIEKTLLNYGKRIIIHPTLKSTAKINFRFNIKELQRLLKVKVEVQDLSSQMVGWACDPQSGEYWWDVCAGSGGKTLQLSALLGRSGKILATDKRNSILKNARQRCEKWNYNKIEFRRWTCEEGENPKSLFDGVLLDAPCSGTGTWRRNSDARWRTSISDINEYAYLQSQLLETCSKAVKPGGKLIYSVCSLLKQETIYVIYAFRKKHPEFQYGFIKNPINRKNDYGISWVFPYEHNSDGMFIAFLLRKY